MKRLLAVVILALIAALLWLALVDDGADPVIPREPESAVPGPAEARRSEPRDRAHTATVAAGVAAETAGNSGADAAVELSRSVRVTVVAAEDAAPVAGAVVELTYDDDSSRVELHTAADGVVVFEGVRAVGSALTARAPGRVRDFDWLDDVQPGDPLDVRLTLGLGMSLAGVVRSDDGRLLDNVCVELEEGGTLGSASSASAGPSLGSVWTDPAGRFVLDGVPAGEIVTVHVRHGTFANYNVSLRLSHAGADQEPLDVRLTAGETVRGVVRDAELRPLPAVRVLAVIADDEDSLSFSMADAAAVATDRELDVLFALTDARGRYEIVGLMPGVSHVVQAFGVRRAWQSARQAVATGVDRVAVTLDLVVLAPGRVVLRVVDAEGGLIESAEVALRRGWVTEDLIGDADELGRFETGDRAPGVQLCEASAPGFVTQGAEVDVVAGEVVERRIVLVRGLSLSGVTLDDRGEVVPGATVSVSRPYGEAYRGLPESRGETKSGDDGAFTIDGLASGPHRLSAYAAKHDGGLIEEIAAGSNGVQVVLLRRARVTLRVVPPSGRAAPQRLGIRRIREGGGGGGYSGDWPEGGRPDPLFVVPGKTTLRILVEGFARTDVVVVVGPGEERDLGDIILDPGVVVTGRVQDPQGRPIAGAQLETGASWSLEHQIVTTDADGRFSLERMPIGSVAVTVRADGFRVLVGHPIDIAGVGDVGVIRLERGALVHGVVRRKDGPGIADATVWFVDLADPGNSDEDFVYADAAGRYALRVRPGRYRVEFRPDEGDPIPMREIEVAEGDDVTVDTVVDELVD